MKLIKKITKHTFKYIVFPLSALSLLVLLTAVAIFYFFPKDKVLSVLISQGESVLKRKIIISDISYNPRGISLKKCRVLTSLDPSDSTLIYADSISLRVVPSMLLHKTIKIKSIVVKNLDASFDYENKKWNIEDLFKDITDSVTSAEDKKIKTEINYIQFQNAHLSLKTSPESIRPLKGDYYLNGIIRATEDTLTINDFSIKLTDSRGLLESNEINIKPLNGNFKITGAVLLTDAALVWLYKWKELDFLPYTHATGIITDLEVTSDYISGTYDGIGKIKGRSPVHASGHFKAFPDTASIRLTDLSVKIDRSTAKVKYIYVPPTGNPSFSVTSLDGYIEEIYPLIPYAPPTIYGKVNGNLSVEGKIVTCDVSIKSGRIGNKNPVISDVNTQLTVKGNILKIEDLQCNFYGQKVKMALAAPESIFKELIINISAGDFNLDKVTNSHETSTEGVSENADKTPPFIVSSIPLRVRGTIEAQSLTKGSYKASNCFFTYDALNQSIKIPRFSFKILDSSATGTLALDISKKNPLCDIKFNVADLKIQRLAEYRKAFESRLFGNGSLRGNIRFNPISENMADTVQGKIDFQISNGKISNTGIQDQLGIFLDPLKYKLKDLEFNRINGTFSIAGRTIQFSPVLFNSNSIRITADGTVSQNETLDSKMVFEFDNSLIQDIPNPAIITLQKYKKGRWYTINFTVRGNMTDSNYEVKMKD